MSRKKNSSSDMQFMISILLKEIENAKSNLQYSKYLQNFSRKYKREHPGKKRFPPFDKGNPFISEN